CPIETPEGTNIGLIASLSIYAKIDEYGFLITPYQVVKAGRVTNEEPKWLRGDEEDIAILAPADTGMDDKGKILGDHVMPRVNGESEVAQPNEVEYGHVGPRNVVGVSECLIPFFVHNEMPRTVDGAN